MALTSQPLYGRIRPTKQIKGAFKQIINLGADFIWVSMLVALFLFAAKKFGECTMSPRCGSFTVIIGVANQLPMSTSVFVTSAP